MAEPSQYELAAWRDIQAYRGRQVTRRLDQVSQKVSNGTANVAGRATKYIEKSPRARAVLERRRDAAAATAPSATTPLVPTSSDDLVDVAPVGWGSCIERFDAANRWSHLPRGPVTEESGEQAPKARSQRLSPP